MRERINGKAIIICVITLIVASTLVPAVYKQWANLLESQIGTECFNEYCDSLVVVLGHEPSDAEVVNMYEYEQYMRQRQ